MSSSRRVKEFDSVYDVWNIMGVGLHWVELQTRISQG